MKSFFRFSIVIFALSATGHSPLVSVFPATVKIIPPTAQEINEMLAGFGGQGTGAITKLLKSVREEFRGIGDDAYSRLQSTQWLVFRVGIASLLGVTVRGILEKYVKRFLFEPQLISEKSSHFIIKKIRSMLKAQEPFDLKKFMVIDNRLAKRLDYLAEVTQNIKNNGGQFENVLLYGEPGTGKTLFAQTLAKKCGMAYALIPGANISQFLHNGTAVEELNQLFTWAASQKEGIILFFDECETFLANRATLSTQAQHALAAFLEKTGTPSNNIMIVCATNRPDVLDSAVLSRLGLKINFPLPDENARKEQLNMHVRNIFGQQKGVAVDYSYLQREDTIKNLAERLDGCSGRAIQQCVNRIRQMALAHNIKEISAEIVEESVASTLVDIHFLAVNTPVSDMKLQISNNSTVSVH